MGRATKLLSSQTCFTTALKSCPHFYDSNVLFSAAVHGIELGKPNFLGGWKSELFDFFSSGTHSTVGNKKCEYQSICVTTEMLGCEKENDSMQYVYTMERRFGYSKAWKNHRLIQYLNHSMQILTCESIHYVFVYSLNDYERRQCKNGTGFQIYVYIHT